MQGMLGGTEETEGTGTPEGDWTGSDQRGESDVLHGEQEDNSLEGQSEEGEPEIFDSIPRLNSGEVTDIARRLVTNVGFMAQSPDELELSFPILIFMAPNMTDNYIAEFGTMYEDYSKAGPRAINNLPMFFSGRAIHKEDVPLICAEWERMYKALNPTVENEA